MTSQLLRRRVELSPIMRAWIVIIMLLGSIGCNAEPDRATQLQERLLAPCCWKGTLRDHESETASALRGEIMSRVAANEASAAIENDFVKRYGEKIRALPAGSDPRWIIPLVAGVAAIVGLALLVMLGRRRNTSEEPPAKELDSAYADRLDDELAAID